jgi:hypothetical protein
MTEITRKKLIRPADRGTQKLSLSYPKSEDQVCACFRSCVVQRQGYSRSLNRGLADILNSTIARILFSGSRMGLIRAFTSGGNSSVWMACVGVVSLSSMGLALSNAVSKLRSMSRLLRCAILAMASSSGSRQGPPCEGVRSIRRRVFGRIFLQSQRVTVISCHKRPDRRAEVFPIGYCLVT